MSLKLIAVFFNVLLAQLGLPVPALPTLVVAGALAGTGDLSPVGLLAAGISACVLADVGWYLAGLRFGNGVMRLLCRLSLTPDSCVGQTQRRFERWGSNALLLSKFVPGLSIVATPLAGATRVGWGRFLLLTTAGSVAWVGAAVACGAIFRHQIAAVLPRLTRLGAFAAFIVCLLLVGYVLYRWWERARFHALLRMARISVDELHTRIESGAAPLILDVRSSTAAGLDPRSIPGAMQVSLTEIEQALRDLPRSREIIAYCNCPNEASAAIVARVLMHAGFTSVRPLLGGLDAWAAAGYPVATYPTVALRTNPDATRMVVATARPAVPGDG